MDIKKKIREQGMTLAEVAKRIGIKAPTLTTIINSTNPKLGSLKKIADAIGVSVSELIADSDDNMRTTVTCPHCGKSITLDIKTVRHNENKAAHEGC